jgi:FAD/FMN-containing dehydrogenase
MDFATELKARFGDIVVIGADIDERHWHDWMVTCKPEARPVAVAYPRTTEDVSALLRFCNEHRRPVVPQGGLTGLTGGSTPVPRCVALSLQRMRAIEEVDAASATITVQAGVPLQAVQEAADAAEMLFPVDIGSRGSCLIGGNVSTNAGGNRVLRYGMMRDMVLGIEAVLADGTVLTSLNKMLKNNAGYDLKQLFVGTEGTLGVITRVVLRLVPKPRSVSTALCALPDYDAALAMLHRAKMHLAASLSAFEVMWPDFYSFATDGLKRRPPLPHGHGIYLLIESMGTDQAKDDPHFSALIETALEDGIVSDAIIAQSLKDSRDMWMLRDASGEMARHFPNVGFDVSIPTGEIDAFRDECLERLSQKWPEARSLFFGHVADSNLHIAVHVDDEPLPVHAIDEVVYGCVRERHGSISAEHGIGLLKKAFLDYTRTPEEVGLMKRLKIAMDPNGILNPGKVF